MGRQNGEGTPRSNSICHRSPVVTSSFREAIDAHALSYLYVLKNNW